MRKRQRDWKFPAEGQRAVNNTQMKRIHTQHEARKQFVAAANQNDDDHGPVDGANINDVD